MSDYQPTERDKLATTRQVIKLNLTPAEAIVVQTCLSGYLPIIAGSRDFEGKDAFLLVASKLLPELGEMVETELTKIDEEISKTEEPNPRLTLVKEEESEQG